jgi:hypothetical protein
MNIPSGCRKKVSDTVDLRIFCHFRIDLTLSNTCSFDKRSVKCTPGFSNLEAATLYYPKSGLNPNDLGEHAM